MLDEVSAAGWAIQRRVQATMTESTGNQKTIGNIKGKTPICENVDLGLFFYFEIWGLKLEFVFLQKTTYVSPFFVVRNIKMSLNEISN